MKGRTYRYFTGDVLYPFGYGLSYTRFAYGNAHVASSADGGTRVSVDVTNAGDHDGDEVVQLYVSHPGASPAPIRALEGFRRIHLAKGETKTVEFPLSDRALSLVDEKGNRAIRPGKVDLWIGGGQPVSRPGLAQLAGIATSFTVTENKSLPK
jgi:beta-glucosidase